MANKTSQGLLIITIELFPFKNPGCVVGQLNMLFLLQKKQECIPVGCVLSAAVAIWLGVGCTPPLPL